MCEYYNKTSQIKTNPPDAKKIPTKDDLLGVTAVVLTVSFRKKEFFRSGYYVYNSYTDQELIESDPEQVLIEKVQRNILADKPRITRFNIDWGTEEGQKSMEEALKNEFEEENKKTEGMLQDKTNLTEMKNDLFRDFDKKMIESSFHKELGGFGGEASGVKESNPFLE